MVLAPPRPPRTGSPPEPEALIEEARARTRRRRRRLAAAVLVAISGAAVVSLLLGGSLRPLGGSARPAGAAGSAHQPRFRGRYGLFTTPVVGGPPAGDSFVRLRRGTLQPTGPAVWIRDYVSNWASAPSGNSIAVATTGGRIVLVDPQHMRRPRAIALDRGLAAGTVVIEGWPSPRRLLAFVYGGYLDGTPLLSQVDVVDPLARRVVTRHRIRAEHDVGGPAAFIQASGGRAWPVVALLSGWSAGPARLLVIDRTGSIRSVELGRIPASTFTIEPGFAVRGERAVVASIGGLLAEVDLRTLAVRYHRIPGVLGGRLHVAAPWEVSSAHGPANERTTSVTWLDRTTVAVRQSRSRPGKRVASSEDPTITVPTQIDSYRSPVAVDTRTWRVVHRRAPRAARQQRVRLGDVRLGGLDTPVVRAYDRRGRLLWTNARPESWEVVAGSLLAHRGADAWYVDPHTGLRIRSLDRAEQAVAFRCTEFSAEALPLVRSRIGPRICGL